jgi:hypothetical protein
LPALTFAAIEVSAETAAGSGIVTLILGIAGLLARRTKDTDERRDALTQLALDIAMDREGKAWAERDAALDEIRQLRAELTAVILTMEEHRAGP